MKLSELQKKDIINIKDGKKVGKIVDVTFDLQNGSLIYFVIERSNFVKSLFTNSNDITITFDQIKKMGEDVILIDIS